MRAKRLESLVWVLVYGGLLAAGLGDFLRRGGAAGGWVLIAVGGVAVLGGAVLVLVRARLPTPGQPEQTPALPPSAVLESAPAPRTPPPPAAATPAPTTDR